MRHLTFMLGACFALAFFATCADLIPGGADLGPSDANAAPPLAADCNLHWSFEINGQTTTAYYARFSVLGMDPRRPPQVTAIACDASSNGVDTQVYWICPDGAKCDPPLANTPCFAASGIAFAATQDVYVYCGIEVLANGKTTGYRWKKVYLKVTF